MGLVVYNSSNERQYFSAAILRPATFHVRIYRPSQLQNSTAVYTNHENRLEFNVFIDIRIDGEWEELG